MILAVDPCEHKKVMVGKLGDNESIQKVRLDREIMGRRANLRCGASVIGVPSL